MRNSFEKNLYGDIKSTIFSCLNFDNFEIGTIGGITGINPGTDYNLDPYVLVYQPYVAAFNRKDLIITVANSTGTFVEGERILQTPITFQYYDISVANATNFVLGEKIYQGTALSSTANATITNITLGNNTIRVNSVEGSLNTSNVYSYISTANSTVSSVNLFEELYTAKGIVKEDSNTTIVSVKRLSFENTFEPGEIVTGQISGISATVVSVKDDENSIQIGLNANVSANVATANGYVTELEIVDSGFGYSNGEVFEFLSEDGTHAGSAKSIISGHGTGSGYFKSSKGFLSTNKYVFDGEYYLEYSYEILSKLPFDKYSEMFKKVLHTAGTKVFGSVVLSDEASIPASVIETSIEEEIG